MTETSLGAEVDPLLDETKGDNTADRSRKAGYISSLKGFSAAFFAVLMIVTSTTSVQLLQRRIPDFELNTIRTAIALLSYSVVMLYRKESLLVPRSEILVTFCFCFLSFVNSIGFYIAVTFVPVSYVEAIRITSGIASGLFLFAVFWKETITTRGVCCAACCVMGVLLITQPPFLFMKLSHEGVSSVSNVTISDASEMEETNTDTSISQYKQIAGHVLPVLCGLIVSTLLLIAIRWPFIVDNKSQSIFLEFHI